jgi:hypothetical protein
MVQAVERAQGAAPESARDSGRSLFWRMVWLYGLGSAAAVVVVCFLVLIGLEFTLWQWIAFLIVMPFGFAAYTLPDIVMIRRQIRPIAEALTKLDRGVVLSSAHHGAALVRALNLPFLSAARVTFMHGPMATVAVILMMVSDNVFFDTGFARWQILAAAAIFLFFASHSHSI